MLLSILNSHFINAVSIVIAVIAGLYGFNGLLGSPGGLLRQLIVGVPSAILYGVIGYYYDEASHHIFSSAISNSFSGIFSLPVTSFSFAIFWGLQGLLLALVNPNTNKESKNYSKIGTGRFILTFLTSFIVLSYNFYLFFQIADTTVKPIPSIHFNDYILITISIILSFLLSLFSARILQAGNLENKKDDGQSTGLLWLLAVGCFPSLIFFGLGIIIFVYVARSVGWVVVLLFVATGLTNTILRRLQAQADVMPEKRLQLISLILFMVAGSLQIYQAIAL